MLHIIVTCLSFFTFVCNQKTFVVEVVNFAMVGVEFCNFGENNSVLLLYGSNFLMEKLQDLLFPNRNDERNCLCVCSMISL